MVLPVKAHFQVFFDSFRTFDLVSFHSNVNAKEKKEKIDNETSHGNFALKINFYQYFCQAFHSLGIINEINSMRKTKVNRCKKVSFNDLIDNIFLLYFSLSISLSLFITFVLLS